MIKALIILEIKEKIRDLILLYKSDKIRIEIDCNKKVDSIKMKLLEIENLNDNSS
jgi:hypothetical protein